MFDSYSEVYHNCSYDYIIEKLLDLVHYSNTFGIRAASKHFRCSKNTIKRWVRRYVVYGKKGLYNYSRASKKTNRKVSQQTIDEIKKIVCDSQEKKKYITSVNVMKELNSINCTYFTINRYVNRFKKKNNRRSSILENKSIELKKELKPFELIQIDIKYLTDISSLKPYFSNRNLCKYQITARDVCSGYTLLSYCYDKSVNSTFSFLKYVLFPFLNSFKELSLKNEVSIQSDNGSEFTNRNVRIYEKDSPELTIFTKFVNENFRKHKLIIPGHCKAQSEVESFHWSIEKDCLAWCDIFDNDSLIKCTSNYLRNFNNKKRFNKDYSPIEELPQYFDLSNISFPDPIIIY